MRDWIVMYAIKGKIIVDDPKIIKEETYTKAYLVASLMLPENAEIVALFAKIEEGENICGLSV